MLLKRVWEVQERVQADCCSITTKKFRVMNIIKPCSLVENNWRFVSTCCFCLQCRSLLPWGWREQVTPKQGQIYTILHIVTVCSSIRQNLTSHQLPCLGKEVEMKPWIFLKRPSLSLSLSLSLSVFSLLVRNERVLIGVINFKGVRVVLLFIRDYTTKLCCRILRTA